MGKPSTRILLSTLLALGMATPAVWGGDGTSGTTISLVQSEWKSAGGSEAVSFAPSRTGVRTADLVAESLDDSAIRPVALQGAWAPEESPSPVIPQSPRLAPEAVTPLPESSDFDRQILLPDNSILNLDQAGGTNPPADPSDNQPVKPSANPPANQPSALPPTAGGGTAETLLPITPFTPNIGTSQPSEEKKPLLDQMREPAPSAKSPEEKKGDSGKLQQSQTRIDRFGNIGALGNSGAQRTEDGMLLGNPYANGQHEYHPRCFQVDPAAALRIRTAPPAVAYGEDGYGNVAYSCGGCGACDECCGTAAGCETGCGTGYGCGLFPRVYWLMQNMQFEAGVFAFKDPLGIGNDNNFGYNLGLNWSTPSHLLFGLAAQAGGRFEQTGKEESFAQDEYGDELDGQSRSQFFWTAGFFYRDPGAAWTFGAVYDAVRDDSYWQYSLGQARVELSRRVASATDFGFRGAFALDDELLNFYIDNDEYEGQMKVNSYYTAFFRHWFCTGAEGMIYAGVTDESEGLVGGHLEVPITNHSSLRNSFVYVIPKSYDHDYIDNSWSVNISWVVYFGGNSQEGMSNPLRPLFDVADNTTLLQRAKAK